jgi:hypothetical protein
MPDFGIVMRREETCRISVIASEAKQSSLAGRDGLLRRLRFSQ